MLQKRDEIASEIRKRENEKNDLKFKEYEKKLEDQKRLMMALQNMRMACDNTYLLDPDTFKGKKN